VPLLRTISERAFPCLLAVALSSLTAPGVHAQPATQPQPAAQDRERARVLMDLGDRSVANRDYQAALKAYQAADDIMKVPTTGVEVGRTLEKLNLLVEAHAVLLRVTRHPARPDDPKPFIAARQAADRMLSGLVPRIPRLTLRAVGLPAGIKPDVTVDEDRIESVGSPILLNPGAHRVVGRANGFSLVKHEVSMAEGESKDVTLAFKALPDGSPDQARAPARSDAGRPAAANERLSRTLMWVGFGVGAAGVAAGGVTGSLSLSRVASAKKDCDGNRCRPAAQEDIDSANVLANVSNVAFAVGAVGLGVGVWQFLETRGASSEAPASSAVSGVRAAVSVGPAGVEVAGTF
jgi:hypothetical protein